MNGRIELTRFVSDPADCPPNQHNWPLAVHATGHGDFPSEIFVIQRRGNRFDPATRDTFSCVASAHDTQEIPSDRDATLESDGIQTPFYRTSRIKLYLRSAEEVEEIWTAIQADVNDLVRNILAADKLLAVDKVEYWSDNTVETTTLDNDMSVFLSIDFRPAGTAEVDSNNNQTIVSPDKTLKGWLPVSGAPPGMSVPPGTRFYYNHEADTDFASQRPFSLPGDKHLFFLNGIKLSHGQTYVINGDGLFWADYSPIDPDNSTVVFQDGEILFSEKQFGNAPWPLDYIDRQNNGTARPEYELMLFR